MGKNRVVLKVLAICTVIIILAGTGILVWQLLTTTSDTESDHGATLFGKETDRGGLFGGAGLFPKNTTTTTTLPSLIPSAMPSESPSWSPSLYEYNKYSFNQCSPDATRCCNGVETLCDWPVNDILFGIPHNAMATNDLFLVPNQQRSIGDALKAGFRGINVDVCRCQGLYKLCHGFCGIGELDPIIAISSMVSFLRLPENQQEVLLLTMELNSDAGEPVDLNHFYETILHPIEGLDDYLYVHDGPGRPWPTLGSMIDDGTRLIVFHYNGPNCNNEDEGESCPRGMHPYFQYVQETPFELSSIDAILDTDTSCVVSRGAASADGSFFAVNNFVTLDTFDSLDKQLEAAATANALEFANQRLKQCARLHQRQGNNNRDSQVNMLYVDFWDLGDIVQVVQEHNQNLGTF